MRCAPFRLGGCRLLKSESSSDELRGVAGSLITLLTDLPVTSETSEEETGSNGVVNIVVPRPSRMYAADAAMMALSSGLLGLCDMLFAGLLWAQAGAKV